MSDNVIDVNHKLNGPDKDLIYTDHNGVQWYKYACAFDHNDTTFEFQIWATSADDAEARMKSIIKTGSVSGQIMSEGGE